MGQKEGISPLKKDRDLTCMIRSWTQLKPKDVVYFHQNIAHISPIRRGWILYNLKLGRSEVKVRGKCKVLINVAVSLFTTQSQ